MIQELRPIESLAWPTTLNSSQLLLQAYCSPYHGNHASSDGDMTRLGASGLQTLKRSSWQGERRWLGLWFRVFSHHATGPDEQRAPDSKEEGTASDSASRVTNRDDGALRATLPRQPQPLPLSPIMDPKAIAARQRYRTHKAGPSKDPTPLQRKLSQSPYAQALATPMRTCAITTTRLPSFFLVNLQLLAHPETDEPWMLPKGLLAQSKAGKVDKEPENVAGEPDQRIHHANPETPATPRQSEESTASLAETTESPGSTSTGPGMYMLARHSFIQSVTRRGRKQWGRLFRPALSEKTGIRAEHIVWRQDMDDFILDLLRRRVITELEILTSGGSIYTRHCLHKLVEGKLPKQVGCVLWLGRECDDTGGPIQAPPLGAIMPYNPDYARHVPAFNLPYLLGDKHLSRLPARLLEVADEGFVALASRRRVIAAHLWLWKLQGHIARADGEEDGLS